MFVFSFCKFVFYFVYSELLYCFVYYLSFCIQLPLSYFYTSLRTAGTGWKPNYSITSYHLQRLLSAPGVKVKG